MSKYSGIYRRQHGYRANWISATSETFLVQIVDSDGRLAIDLSRFLRDLSRFIAIGTARRYVSALLHFLSWWREHFASRRHEYPSPKKLRGVLEKYLREECNCRLRPRRGTQRQDSFCAVLPTARTAIDVRGLLTALRHLYTWHIAKQSIRADSPMVIGDSDRITESELKAINHLFQLGPVGNPPDIAGIAPTREHKLSDNYYRLQEGEWFPQCIDDPNLPREILHAAIAIRMPQRDLCVTRLLFESGGRISEVTGLTILDWWATRFLNGASASDKGSGGVRRKFFVWSQDTTKGIREYFDGDRVGYSPHKYTLADVQHALMNDPSKFEDEPLFITIRGNPLSPGYYRRRYWKQATTQAGIRARPHQARHWFTTNTLQEIDQNSETESATARSRKSFVKYMAWRSGERMLDVYDHRPTSPHLLTHISRIHGQIDARTEQASRVASRPCAPGKDSDDLLFILGEDK